jgi:outer membrane biosynthesis protein TonB
MSLEKAIVELTEQIVRLSNVIAASGITTPTVESVAKETPVEAEEAPKESPAQVKKREAKEKREAKKKKLEEGEAAEAAEKAEEGDTKKATLADVRTAARPFIKANMATDIREILQEYGADNLKELEAKHFGDVVEAIGGLELPEA